MFCSLCGGRLKLEAACCPDCGEMVLELVRQRAAERAARQQVSWLRRPVDIRQVCSPVVHVLKDLHSLDLRWLVPIDTAFSPKIVQNPATWVMLLFGFFPLAVLGLHLVRTMDELLFLFCAYFMMAWAAYFYVFVDRRTSSFKLGVAVLAFTAIFGSALVLYLQHVWPVTLAYRFAHTPLMLSRLAGYAGVGLNEEGAKLLPVLLVAFVLKRVRTPLDGIFYGAMSGLGFGMVEGLRYVSASGDEVTFLIQSMLRTTSLPFMHALWSSIAGYFVALSLVSPRRRVSLVLAGLIVTSLGHGIYDALSGGPLGVALAACLYFLFMAYLERSQDMVRELQRAEALAGTDVTAYAGPASLGTIPEQPVDALPLEKIENY